MSALRKMRRAAQVDARKQIKKHVAPKIKLAEAARLIVKKNYMRLWLYCQTYYFPLFGWVMYRHYGFRFRRLVRLDAEINHIWELITESKNGPHVFHKIEWVFEALEIEGGYQYERQKTPKPEGPDCDTAESMVQYFAKAASITIIEQLEVVWLWVLYAIFGFGKKRLEDARRYLAAASELTYEEFTGRLAEMETCTWRHDGRIDCMCFDTVRSRLKELGIEGPDMVLPLKW